MSKETEENRDLAIGIFGLVQMGILIWWSIVTPWPKHIVLIAWFLELEGSLWYSEWRGNNKRKAGLLG